VELFHESLCYKGFLGIGASESLRFSRHAERFAEIDRDDRIYQKVAA
jgi:chemotaxis protein methyltransferase CheR